MFVLEVVATNWLDTITIVTLEKPLTEEVHDLVIQGNPLHVVIDASAIRNPTIVVVVFMVILNPNHEGTIPQLQLCGKDTNPIENRS
mgnify:CR=1 FL=1